VLVRVDARLADGSYVTTICLYLDGLREGIAKNIGNIAKHGIDFEDAIRIFEGPVLESPDKRREYGEIRIIAFGVFDDRELVVVYTRACRTSPHYFSKESTLP